ncbi:hypothetical protein [Sulfobacillus thermosulfidooxidans]|uniref:hypothetical protein n=1 Tax=Sulfobacillus thermosulfidooxidans TaxID=28034 RepID=UPI000423DA3D|nr:hypothetical protein [Sulfobacillus thermosulfidooxidans]
MEQDKAYNSEHENEHQGQRNEEKTRTHGESSHQPSQTHDRYATESVNSLNEAIRKELGYLDIVIATPFRAVRRTMGAGSSPWAKSLDELTWALEGMARVPVKMLQSAFGENFSQKDR